MSAHISNFWYLILVLFPIIGSTGIFFIPFKKRDHMCIYTETITILTSILSFVIMTHRPEEPRDIITFVSKFSISLGFDGMGTIFGGLISFLWPFATLYAFDYMKHEAGDNTAKETTFFGFYTMTFGVTLGIASAANLLTMYIFYEMLTLVTVPLIVFTLSREATLATRTYLYYSLGGAAFGFVTLVFLSNYGNSLDFVLGGILHYNGDSNTVEVAEGTIAGAMQSIPAGLMRLVYLFGFFGFGVKAAIFPLSAWLPKAGVAPTPVTALLHAVAVVKAGAFAILRITYYSFGTDVLRDSFAQCIPMAFAIFTIVYGCSQAVRERHLKRRLAYSTISNLSYILFGCLVMTPLGLVGALTHMLFHGIMKICSFFCAGIVIEETGREYVYEVDGLGRRMPKTFGAFTVSALSLMGVPLLCGFLSKWNLASAAASSGLTLAYIGIGALLVSALLTAIYMLQIVIRAYFPEKGFNYSAIERFHDPGWKMILPLAVFVILMIVFGLFGNVITELLTEVANGSF
ncbi:MAG: proton-conducting membrane transporter [Lachnospiraceae bacterium]|nr:proton-conducting membrane transporter [Lachnospiraceae bacterium]